MAHLNIDRLNMARLRTDPFEYTIVPGFLGSDGVNAIIDSYPDIGKGGDLIKTGLHLRAREAEDRTAEKDILPPGKLMVKAAAQLQQCRHFAIDGDPPMGRLKRPRDQF